MLQRPPMSPTKKSRNSSGNITPLTRTTNEGIVKGQYQPLTPTVHSPTARSSWQQPGYQQSAGDQRFEPHAPRKGPAKDCTCSFVFHKM